jgi:glycosidase
VKLSLVLPAVFLCASLSCACSNAPDEATGAEAAAATTRQESDIVLPEGTTFEARECTVTVRYSGSGNDVRIAGEFTSPAWQDRQPLTKNGDVHEITLAPGPNLEAGTLYAYKLIVDGSWILDPNGKYRKIVGGQMNSGVVLPSCASGPEILADKVSVNDGDMKVHVALRAPTDGVAPEHLKASFDGKTLPDGAFAVSATGGVDFSLRGLAKGKHTLSLRAFDKQARESDPIDLPFWVEDEPFDYRDGILYMLLIDRFSNGDASNDRPIGAPVDYDADWHGGDLQGALRVLESGYFEKLGVRTIWLSPLNTQTDKHEIGDGNQIYSGYHGYWPVKSREVEPRFGGEAALRAFVTEAHKRGVRVLLDLINNQVHEDHEYVSANPSWFRRVCKCGDDAAGCGWSQRPFDCFFQPYLPDIDWNQPGAEKQFIADAVHWISEFDLDGFRVDAVKHVEANSVFNMRAELSRRFEQGGARIFMVGETAVGEYDSGTFFGEHFGNGFEWIDAYTGPNALDGQFDFPTRHNMADGLVNGDRPLDEVERELEKAEARYRPGNRHVRFLNGHDNPRIASIAAKDPKLGCAWASGCRGDQLPPDVYSDPEVYVKLKRALTVLYTMPGVPYLYMGDESAFPGGGDPDMRRNMLFGEGLEALQMTKPGALPRTLTGQQVDLRSWVRKLGAARSSSRALRRGERKALLGNDGDLWVYAYAYGGETALVAINRGAAVASRSIDASPLAVPSTAQWESALGTGSATSGADGALSISLDAGEAAIFIAR